MSSSRISLSWNQKRVTTLADIVAPNLCILFVGLNPSPVSVAAGHYHQGKLGQRFWRRLVEFGILPAPTAGVYHDELLLKHGLGITDLAKSPAPTWTDISKSEASYARATLRETIRLLAPKIVAFIYKRAATIFYEGGVQKRVERSEVFVLPGPYGTKAIVRDQMSQLKQLQTSLCHD